jgi:hypothetical protein
VRFRNGPPLSRGRRILKQNQIIPSFPRKRESIRSQSATFAHFDFFPRPKAGIQGATFGERAASLLFPAFEPVKDFGANPHSGAQFNPDARPLSPATKILG